MDFETTIEIYDIDIEIIVSFDYQPFEPVGRHYPGCEEDASIYEATLITGEEICLMPDMIPILEERILESRCNDWIAT